MALGPHFSKVAVQADPLAWAYVVQHVITTWAVAEHNSLTVGLRGCAWRGHHSAEIRAGWGWRNAQQRSQVLEAIDGFA